MQSCGADRAGAMVSQFSLNMSNTPPKRPPPSPSSPSSPLPQPSSSCRTSAEAGGGDASPQGCPKPCIASQGLVLAEPTLRVCTQCGCGRAVPVPRCSGQTWPRPIAAEGYPTVGGISQTLGSCEAPNRRTLPPAKLPAQLRSASPVRPAAQTAQTSRPAPPRPLQGRAPKAPPQLPPPRHLCRRCRRSLAPAPCRSRRPLLRPLRLLLCPRRLLPRPPPPRLPRRLALQGGKRGRGAPYLTQVPRPVQPAGLPPFMINSLAPHTHHNRCNMLTLVWAQGSRASHQDTE